MVQGIAILGLNGSGKSTLAHALSDRIGYYEMDVEDYYFPELKKSRREELQNDNVVETKCRGELPFLKPRVKSVVQDAIILDINAHPNFIISSVTMNWCDEILSKLDVAFMVCTPLEIRLKRIQDRERKRFGTRVLPGGDMYEQQLKFRNMVLARQERVVEESAKRLKCPVVVLDGTVSVADNLNRIMGIIHVRDI